MNKFFLIAFLILVLTMLVILPVFANEAATLSLIETESIGLLEVEPDICYINFNVQTEALNSAESQGKNADLTRQVLQTMINSGLAHGDFNTGSFSTYSYQEQEKSTAKYRTNAAIKLIVRDLDQVGSLLTKLAKFNEVNINNLKYDVQNTAKYKQEAINQAVREAKETLTMTANSLGMNLDKIQRIRVSFDNSLNIIPFLKTINTNDSQIAAQPQNPENIKISASVYLEYSIK